MTYDVSFLAGWLALAALVGVGVGWWTEAPGPQAPLFQGRFRAALIVLAVVFVAALVHLFSGRLAFWLESAALFGIVYLVGCFLGGAARRTRIAG
jgi:uncharacterized membrane-anchored protein